MTGIEELGMFFLGREAESENPLLYDSRDLMTHAMCVGMTGSGKTGLCIGLLEEAAIDGIPAIIIDPKGDLGNLLLQFPDLAGADFEPWVDPEQARRASKTVPEFAQGQANLWRKGLGKWGQDGKRIERLLESAEFSIYTPGSNAGLPVSIVDSFNAPPPAAREDYDLLRDKVRSTTSGLLEILGIDSDPLQSREHILIATIIERAWVAGENLDLAKLILSIQSPPVDRIGVFELDAFFPSTERMKLAMAINNLLAAPGFRSWLEGQPLRLEDLLYTDKGKPRHAIFSIAHLSQSERMFFVTLLLNQVVGWMRTQSGTSSLRAILYMDEVFGYFPPVGEPPSKRPLMLLLKQARAFGLGVVLSTQNPVDLDYKGLSNMGTWFVGRLQTDNDRERLIDGLAGSGSLNKREMMDLIASLDKRQFIIHNVHEPQPLVFGTRWVLSYLCGPLTRTQIKRLMDERRRGGAPTAASPKVAPKPPPIPLSTSASGAVPSMESRNTRPIGVPDGLPQYYAEMGGGSPDLYRPFLLGVADIPYFSSRYGVSTTITGSFAIPIEGKHRSLSWDDGVKVELPIGWQSTTPVDGLAYEMLDTWFSSKTLLNRLDRQFESYLYRSLHLTLMRYAPYKMTAEGMETERDFRVRLRQESHDRRNMEMDRIRRRYAARIASVEKQLVTAQNRLSKEEADYKDVRFKSVLDVGSDVVGALFGKRRLRSRFNRASSSVSRVNKEKRDIAAAEKRVELVESKIRDLDAKIQSEIDQMTAAHNSEFFELDQVVIRPRKTDIVQRCFGLLWVPYDAEGRSCSDWLQSERGPD